MRLKLEGDRKDESSLLKLQRNKKLTQKPWPTGAIEIYGEDSLGHTAVPVAMEADGLIHVYVMGARALGFKGVRIHHPWGEETFDLENFRR